MGDVTNPAAKLARASDEGRSVLQVPRVAAFVERWIAGEDWREAAKAEGLRLRRARILMAHPVVRKHYFAELDRLKENERARNLKLYTTVRDRGLTDGATAAQQKVAIEAAKSLEPAESAGLTINGGQNVIAGYVIRLPAPGEGPRTIPRHRQAEDV